MKNLHLLGQRNCAPLSRPLFQQILRNKPVFLKFVNKVRSTMLHSTNGYILKLKKYVTQRNFREFSPTNSTYSQQFRNHFVSVFRRVFFCIFNLRHFVKLFYESRKQRFGRETRTRFSKGFYECDLRPVLRSCTTSSSKVVRVCLTRFTTDPTL